MTKNLSIIIAACLAFAFQISWAQKSEKKDAKPKSIQDRIEAIQIRLESAEQAVAMANKKKECDVDSQCEIFEMGERHCGGPNAFIVVSRANPRYSEVKQKLGEYTAVQKEMNLIDPPIECTSVPKDTDGKCLKYLCNAIPRK